MPFSRLPASWRGRGGGPFVPGGRDPSLPLVARVTMSAQRALTGVVLPIYLASLGYSAIRLAALFVAVAVLSAVISAFIGVSSDRIGRKPFLVALPVMTAAAAAVFMMTSSEVALFIAAAAGSFGRGSGAGGGQVGPYQPAEQALLAGMVEDRQRPRLFGLVASASALGGLIGSLLAALPSGQRVGQGPAGPHTYLWAWLLALLLPLVAAACAVPVREIRRGGGSGSRFRAPRNPLTPESRRLVLKLAATNITNGMAVGLFGPFITYWLYRRFGAGTAEVGALYAVVNVITVGSNLCAAPIARRLGVVRTVVLARSLQALLLIPMALSPTFAVAGAVYTLRMIAQRQGLALRQSFVMTSAPEPDRARVAAFSNLPSQGISAVTPLLTGYLLDEVSLALPLELAGALQFVNAMLFQLLFASADREHGPESEPLAEGERRV